MVSVRSTLVLNCGSSSVKFSVFTRTADGLTQRISGVAERLTQPEASLTVTTDRSKTTELLPGGDHKVAVLAILGHLRHHQVLADIDVVGHRVVHGGEHFAQSVVVDDNVFRLIRSCERLAPLHNPANVAGIELVAEHLPNVLNVAVFDTAFHQSIPPVAYRYAVPASWYTNHAVRRYGFHGTSHQYVSAQAAVALGNDQAAVLTAHLGNGCSAAAVQAGCCVDTTMGLTPLDGLVMGTRSGSVDPGLHSYVADQLGWTLAEVTAALNRESGLAGLSGLSNDMRTLLEAEAGGHRNAGLAIDVFCYRLAKELLGLGAGLQRIDGIVFTGGIGENSAAVRARTATRLRVLGVEIDPARNEQHGAASDGRINVDGTLPLLVIPTAEELMIASEASELMESMR